MCIRDRYMGMIESKKNTPDRVLIFQKLPKTMNDKENLTFRNKLRRYTKSRNNSDITSIYTIRKDNLSKRVNTNKDEATKFQKDIVNYYKNVVCRPYKNSESVLSVSNSYSFMPNRENNKKLLMPAKERGLARPATRQRNCTANKTRVRYQRHLRSRTSYQKVLQSIERWRCENDYSQVIPLFNSKKAVHNPPLFRIHARFSDKRVQIPPW
eukprot:TRINITY_DN3213_c0_g1_i8.p1 TRINITY_DN3213_c0_g1~~TRINITY_DN3213_c0_g1_i8.p1  ORF type:complete len:211 (-),score=12.24 TRINITY_DN3213_c0_g1_i8:210-842(-)